MSLIPDNPYQPPTAESASNVTLPQAVRGFTRGRTLVRLSAVVAFFLTVFTIVFTGMSGQGSRALAMVGLRVVVIAILGVQGAMLWGYANRLKTLHRSPSLENVAEAMRWLRYAWVAFLVTNVLAQMSAATTSAVKAMPAMAGFVTRGIDGVTEAVALRRTALASAAVYFTILLLQLADFYVEQRQNPSSLVEVVFAALVFVSIFGAVIWLTLNFASALYGFAKAPSNDTLLAASRAYGHMFGTGVFVLALLIAVIVFAVATGHVKDLQGR